MEAREVKIRFQIEQSEGLSVRTEDLWAEPHEDGTFQISNVPFFVYGISSGDFVLAEMHDHVLRFLQVHARGRHSTYRLFLGDNVVVSDAVFQEFWEPISALGATLENANGHFVAVDIPPNYQIDNIYKHLKNGEEAGVWELDEGYRYQAPH